MDRSSILESIGKKPIYKLNRLASATFYSKAEFLNPGGSVKGRIAKYMIGQA
jgi:cysteine synthase